MRCVLLCSNNYLGLANHPLLKEAAISAVEHYGTGSGASRLVSGTMELHEALERRIAAFKGTEAALVFNSGYAANTGIIPAIADRGDVIFSDRLNHASIVDGALLSRAKLVRYPHNDMITLRRLLSETESIGRRLIVTDGVFSMDGDLAPLKELVSIKEEFGALLMVDDAHATGVLGATGRGSAEQCGVKAGIDIHMGTLGKALGSFGAYAAASREIIDYLINRARSFIFSTSLPPAVLAAGIAALDVVDSPEGAELRRKLANNSRYRSEMLSVMRDLTLWEAPPRSFPYLSAGRKMLWRFRNSSLKMAFLSRVSALRLFRQAVAASAAPLWQRMKSATLTRQSLH